MRITGGYLRGRALVSPPDQTVRPTADKARLAVFNMLESRGAVRDAVVIDAFCGTGALGLEALSRGAQRVLMIDRAASSIDLARANAEKLGVTSSCQFVTQDVTALSLRSAAVPPATLIFLDPPYRQDLIEPVLQKLVQQNWIAAGAIFVAEAEKGWDPAWPDGFEEVVRKTYGQSAVFMVQWTPKE